MRTITFIFVVVLIAVSSCKIRSSKQLLYEAAKCEERGDFHEAILLLNEAIHNDTSYLPAYLNRGADESALGHYKAAIDTYSEVVRRSPVNTLALLNRGKNKSRLGNYRAALEDFQSAVAAKGGVYSKTALQLEYLGNEGFECSMPEILLERGAAYYNLDSLNRAFHDFQVCIENHYAPGIAYRFRGFIYIASGKKDWGCADLKNAAGLGDTDAANGIAKYCD